MSWPSVLFLSIVAVACLVTLAWIQSVYTPAGTRSCSMCRARQQCQPGGEGQCCCRAVDSDGCYYGLGLCQAGLTCTLDGTGTGTCHAITGPEQASQHSNADTCNGANYAQCTATEFGDCCCPPETPPPASACSPELVCHTDAFRFTSATGTCVPRGLFPPS